VSLARYIYVSGRPYPELSSDSLYQALTVRSLQAALTTSTSGTIRLRTARYLPSSFSTTEPI